MERCQTHSKPICGIYMIQCRLTGERYIGQSVDILRRYTEHKTPNAYPQNKFHKDIQKIGIPYFDLFILEECNKESLDEREVFWINFCEPEYNLCQGGKGATGHVVSEDLRRILSDKAKTQWQVMDEATRKKLLSNLTGHRKGYKMSEYTKQKLIESHKGKKWTPEQRIKVAETKRLKKENGYVQSHEKHKKQIICIDTNEVFPSVLDAAKHFEIRPSCISAVLTGRQKATHKLHFIYKETKDGDK